MNRRTSVLLGLFIVIVIGLALTVGLMGGQSAGSVCKGNSSPVAHKVVIKDGKVSDGHVKGKLCDTLTIINDDSVTREVAFGPHEHHVPYDGIAERLLSKNQSLTITLNQAGSFHWHDHIHDEVEGYFAVSK
ncbi:MAG TPA: hypothetical protein VLG92_01830 [Candidatus Saccharimonadia bacterium]|nr:hypothetical protein [Candidatus Saccharimonadia bacterium]